MSFLHGKFYLCLLIFLLLYHGLKGHEQKKNLVLIASLAFYAQFSWAFFALLILTVVVDFFVALQLEKSPRPLWLWPSLLVNFAPLLWFKLQPVTGVSSDPAAYVVPMGISFYTFKSVAYTLDVYRGVIPAVRHFRDYALFVTFFPTVLSGPVERAKFFFDSWKQSLKPQWVDGISLIAWGLAKKILVADKLAALLAPIWDQTEYLSLNVFSSLFLCLVMSIRLYCDFSGYSDIARGIGKLLGLEIPLNFNFPYFAKNPSEFWSRQHITMSQWFQDYVFYPVMRSFKKPHAGVIVLALAVTFMMSAAWHGLSKGTFYFFVLQFLLNATFFLSTRFFGTKDSKVLRVVTFLITQVVCAVSIFCLLAPDTKVLDWVLQGFVQWRGEWLFNSLFVVAIMGLALIHTVSYKTRKVVVNDYVRLVIAGLLCALVLLIEQQSYEFIYFRF